MSDVGSLLRTAIESIVGRELATLRREVDAYPNETDLWSEVPGLPNSGGTLVLHLAGNLQHFFGRELGGSSYVRNRPAEFSQRNVTRADLHRQIDAAGTAVALGLSRLVDSQLLAPFPDPAAGGQLSTGVYLVHLLAHLAYHLGQLDYHRRMVTGKADGVGAVRPAELISARVPERQP
jgi:Protein of unknown function (DUF664)